MKTKTLWLTWLYFYILCAVLGFIPEPTGFWKFLLVAAALAFFVPGFGLLQKGGEKTARVVLILSVCSLLLTLVLIILNFASALMTKVWGDVLYVILVILSSPMICAQYWALSLFGWACLMVTAISKLRKRK